MKSKHIISLLWVSVCASILTIRCSSNPASDQGPPGYIAGTVIDSLTSFPLDSAWVDGDTNFPYRTYTDSQGTYIISAPNIPGQMSLFCGKSGYKTKMSPAFVTVPGDTIIVDFELSP